uniref:DNA helicase n=1 Tax=Lactuca sativa TaxID=4236 RepID=A0A9R1WG71_LACSA|nr:hypothetical protein LSAT_V11C200064090 [Lactuca sativa]
MLGFVSRPCLLLLKLNMSYSFYYKRWFVKWWLKEHISSEPHNLSLGSFFWVPLVSENLLSVIDVAPLSLVRSYIDDSSIATTVERSMKQLIALVPKEIPRLTLRFFPFFDPSPFPHNPPPAAVANPFLFTDAEYGIKSDDFLIILCAEARKFLVDSYVALPRGDTTPGSRVAYSMTVRQLEALIRLLEAISRCHLDDEVHPRHVKLATRLLKTSVIRHNSNSLQTYVSLIIVESTEIDLTEFQEENQEEGDVEPQIADVDADSNNDQPDKKLVKDQNLHKNLISDKRTKRSQLKLQMAFDGQERDVKRFWEPSIFTLSTKMLKEHEISHNTIVKNKETSPSVLSNKSKRHIVDVFHNVDGFITETLKEKSNDLNQCINFFMNINELSEKIPLEILNTNSLSQLENFKALNKIRSDPIYHAIERFGLNTFWNVTLVGCEVE